MQNLIAQIGTINPPPGVPVPFNPANFIGRLIRGSIQFLLVAGFVIALFWTIFAGYRFITSSGDPKSTGQAWSQIYWGLIGLVVIMGSYAIMRLVERFFNVNIITGGITLPQF